MASDVEEKKSAKPTENTASQRVDATCTNGCDKDEESAACGCVVDVSNLISPAPAIASSRYNRQMLIPSISVRGQERISHAKVLVVGLGGLGSPAALYLAGAGVGTLGLLDDDYVEETNLHRQIVHRESSVQGGMSKVESALRGCRDLNSNIELVQHALRLDVSSRKSADNVLRIFEEYDIVLDCTDNPATRYLINDLCVLLGKTLVSGAAQRLEGQILVLNYLLPDKQGRGPCYRCVFPVPPSPEMVQSCGEIGILGPVVGTIGTLMATETLRLIVKGEDETRKPSMLLYNAWPQDPRSMFRTIGLRGKRLDCIACSKADVLRSYNKDKITRENISKGRIDYIAFCGVSQDAVLETTQRISASEFVRTITTGTQVEEYHDASEARDFVRPLIVDVREPYEIEMGTKIQVGINIPISRILSNNAVPGKLMSSITDRRTDAVLFVCQRGNDSQVAAKKLIDWCSKEHSTDLQKTKPAIPETPSNVFIGDVIGGLSAVEKSILKGL